MKFSINRITNAFDYCWIKIHGNGPKEGNAIPFNLHLSIPTIKGKVVLNNDESLDGSFFIITGAGTTLDLNSPFSRENDIINKTGKHYSYLVKSINKKETSFYEGHVRSFTFDDQKVEDLPIGISTANAGIQADKSIAGIIGNEILSMFNITIDVPDKMMYFTKNSNFGRKFIVNCSGIDLQLAPDKTKILVHQVIENSPASKAGIKSNSEIMAIDGLSAEELTLPEIERKLKQEGEKVTLKIKQDDEIKEFTPPSHL